MGEKFITEQELINIIADINNDYISKLEKNDRSLILIQNPNTPYTLTIKVDNIIIYKVALSKVNKFVVNISKLTGNNTRYSNLFNYSGKNRKINKSIELLKIRNQFLKYFLHDLVIQFMLDIENFKERMDNVSLPSYAQNKLETLLETIAYLETVKPYVRFVRINTNISAEGTNIHFSIAGKFFGTISQKTSIDLYKIITHYDLINLVRNSISSHQLILKYNKL